VDLREEGADEAEVVLFDQKIWNAGSVREWSTYQGNAWNPNVTYAIKRGIQRNFALENQ